MGASDLVTQGPKMLGEYLSNNVNSAYQRWQDGPSMTREEARERIVSVQQSVDADEKRYTERYCEDAAKGLVKDPGNVAKLFKNIKLNKDPSDAKLDPAVELKLNDDAQKELAKGFINTAPLSLATDKQFFTQSFKALLASPKSYFTMEEAIQAYEKSIKDIPKPTAGNDRALLLGQIKADMLLAIDAQQQHESSELKKFFLTDAFKKSVEAAGGNEAEAQKKLELALKDSHDTQKKEFENGVIPGQVRELEIRQRAEASALLCTIMKSDKNFSEHMRKNRPQTAMLSISAGNANTEADRFTGADFEEYYIKQKNKYMTRSGKEITFEDGKFHLKSSGFGWKIMEKDAEELMLFAKAAGKTEITIMAQHSNPAKAEKLAEMAYSKAIAAGFPPDKIHVKYKNEKGETVDFKPPDALKNGPVLLSTSTRNNQDALKQQFQAVRQQPPAQASAPPADSPANRPGVAGTGG